MTSWIGVVTTQLTDKTGFDIRTTPVTLYTDIEHKTQLIFDVNMQMLLLLLLVYYYYYSTFGFCICVPRRLTSCLFSVGLLDSQPTATELFQSQPFGSGTVFRSTSHRRRHFPSSALA